MARYTTYTAKASLPISYTFRCSCCGKQVTKSGAIVSTMSSAPMSSYVAKGYNTDQLRQIATQGVPDLLKGTYEAIKNGRAAVDEKDIKTRSKMVKKNRSWMRRANLNDRCDQCKAYQGWRKDPFGAGWITLVVCLYYLATMMLFIIRSIATGEITGSIVVNAAFMAIFGIAAVLITIIRKKKSREVFARMNYECFPTITVMRK